MKNSFNISKSSCGFQCALCQDTLLRHISQSKVFWYCPSCRQEMVCEGQNKSVKPVIATHVGQRSPNQKSIKVAADYSQQVSIRASEA